MIFASTPPINDDPKPYSEAGFANLRRVRALGPYDVLSPRREYDRPRAHEANPIIVEFRRYTYGWTDGVSDEAGLWAAEDYPVGPTIDVWDTATREQSDHARRVLTRLAAL